MLLGVAERCPRTGLQKQGVRSAIAVGCARPPDGCRFAPVTQSRPPSRLDSVGPSPGPAIRLGNFGDRAGGPPGRIRPRFMAIEPRRDRGYLQRL
jgi:hypothetical protein